MSLTGQGSQQVTITGAPVTGSGANGELTLWNSATTITGKGTFLWDDTLGINSPNLGSDVDGNTRVGVNAGDSIAGGLGNTCVGYQAGTAITSGTSNSFFGINAGQSLTTGASNVAIGVTALSSATVQDGNVAIGDKALYSATVIGAVGIGSEAGRFNTTGAGCVFLGYRAGSWPDGTLANWNTTGNYNTYLGSETGSAVVGQLNNTTMVGRRALANADNQVILGNGVTAVFCGGLAATAVVRGKTANLNTVPVYADNAAALLGGLVAGDLYRTGGDPDPICIVH